MRNIVRFMAVVLLFATGCAFAQKYPDRPVRMLIGFTPGTATDIIARVLGQKLGDGWGQNVVAENRPGAGSTIAAGFDTFLRKEIDDYSRVVKAAGIKPQ